MVEKGALSHQGAFFCMPSSVQVGGASYGCGPWNINSTGTGLPPARQCAGGRGQITAVDRRVSTPCPVVCR